MYRYNDIPERPPTVSDRLWVIGFLASEAIKDAPRRFGKWVVGLLSEKTADGTESTKPTPGVRDLIASGLAGNDTVEVVEVSPNKTDVVFGQTSQKP